MTTSVLSTVLAGASCSIPLVSLFKFRNLDPTGIFTGDEVAQYLLLCFEVLSTGLIASAFVVSLVKKVCLLDCFEKYCMVQISRHVRSTFFSGYHCNLL